jgi:hypothetical protein
MKIMEISYVKRIIKILFTYTILENHFQSMGGAKTYTKDYVPDGLKYIEYFAGLKRCPSN